MPDALLLGLLALAVCVLFVINLCCCDDEHLVEHRLRRGADLHAVVGSASSASGDAEELYSL